MLKDGLKSLVGAHSRPVGPLGRGLNTFLRVAPAETDDAEAGSVALFRVGSVKENGLDQLAGLRTDHLGFGDEARFHGPQGQADLDLLADEGVGDAVVVVVHLYVVVDVHPGLLPLGELVAPAREGFESRPVQLLEE